MTKGIHRIRTAIFRPINNTPHASRVRRSLQQVAKQEFTFDIATSDNATLSTFDSVRDLFVRSLDSARLLGLFGTAQAYIPLLDG